MLTYQIIYIYYIVCTNIQAKLNLIILIILEASIYDEGVLSEGFLSERSSCPEGVMYGGGFVQGSFVQGFFSSINVCTLGWLFHSQSKNCISYQSAVVCL